MTIQSLAAPDGLSPAEMVHLIVFAANADLRIETGATDEGAQFASLLPRAGVDVDDAAETWTVSREKGRVIAFNETHGPLPHRKSVAALLRDLVRVMPTAGSRAPRLGLGA